jgi:hypothetical protein
MIRLLYGTLILMVSLDAIASTLAAWYIFRLRQRFSHYLAWAFTGVAAEAAIAVITTGFSPTPQKIVVWVVVVRILARLFKTVTMVLFPLFLLGLINGDHPEVMKNDK